MCIYLLVCVTDASAGLRDTDFIRQFGKGAVREVHLKIVFGVTDDDLALISRSGST